MDANISETPPYHMDLRCPNNMSSHVQGGMGKRGYTTTLPARLPFPLSAETVVGAIMTAVDGVARVAGLLAEADTDIAAAFVVNVELVAFPGDAAGNPTKRPRGAYVCGGGFANDYDPGLSAEELATATRMRRFFLAVDQLNVDGTWPPLEFQEFHDVLEIAMRALASCLALVRHHGYFATRPGVKVTGMSLFRLLHKCIILSQHASMMRYMPAIEAAVQRAEDDEGIEFEMMWAAICDHARIPHVPTVCSFQVPASRMQSTQEGTTGPTCDKHVV